MVGFGWEIVNYGQFYHTLVFPLLTDTSST
jgi:hypothetical protein